MVQVKTSIFGENSFLQTTIVKASSGAYQAISIFAINQSRTFPSASGKVYFRDLTAMPQGNLRPTLLCNNINLQANRSVNQTATAAGHRTQAKWFNLGRQSPDLGPWRSTASDP